MGLPPAAGLRPVDAVEATIVVDGSVDILLASRGPAERPRLAHDWSDLEQLRAEHGYALVVETQVGDERHVVVYDAGLGRDTFVHNVEVLGTSAPWEAEAFIVSHGHADHHSGLEGVVRRRGRRGLPLILHPEARVQRRIRFPTGVEIAMPPPSTADLEAEGATVLDEEGPTLWGNDTILVSGEVARTSFERGMPPFHERHGEDGWEPDTIVRDDQNVVISVRGVGLVVFSSCSHAGTINILRNARRLTGIESIHAFVGGMHLTGIGLEAVIEPTVAALIDLAPKWLVPGHCTGWQAQAQMATRLPDAYVASSVGTRLRFAATEVAAQSTPTSSRSVGSAANGAS
jgi:7,8-dihydropterin-6-yl-methyl-4-(beta-D-ribofuranosyl)aminobenzene 5'-phosphate synthase